MLKLAQSELLSKCSGIEHGVYLGPRKPYFTRDENDHAAVDVKGLFEYLELPKYHALAVGEQEHTDNIFVLKNAVTGDIKSPNTDALITNQKKTHLLVTTADCLPVLIYDQKNRVIAAIHSGWSGIIKKIVVKTLERMATEFGSQKEDFIIYIGPSIGPCCYAVDDEERLSLFDKEYKNLKEKNGRRYIDLWDSIEQDLLKFGIKKENIENQRICTACNEAMLPSHYREQGQRKNNIISMISMI